MRLYSSMSKHLHIIYITLVTLLMMSCGADQAVKKGDRFLAVGEYYDAAEQYKKAYSQTSNKERTTRGQRAKKLAECYRRLNQTNKAISAYNNVVRYKQADSLTHLYLGQLYMRNGNYKEAAKQFAVAVDSLQTDSLNLQLAKVGLESAQKAPQWKRRVQPIPSRRWTCLIRVAMTTRLCWLAMLTPNCSSLQPAIRPKATS